jgi:hypothetical protein
MEHKTIAGKTCAKASRYGRKKVLPFRGANVAFVVHDHAIENPWFCTMKANWLTKEDAPPLTHVSHAARVIDAPPNEIRTFFPAACHCDTSSGFAALPQIGTNVPIAQVFESGVTNAM